MNDKIIPYLVKMNYVTNEQVQKCLAIRDYYLQKGQNVSLCQILVQQKFIAVEQLQKLMHEQSTRQTAEFTAHKQPPQFGRYVLKDTLGQGGMGTVYRVFDPQLRRDVALKVMNQAYASEKQKQKFEREAVMMASLDHSNIVRLFDYGQHNGKPFITMEIIAGQPLGSYMRDLELPKLVNILIDVCEAVHFAHTHGVVHRDLKPDNVMVTEKLQPKVMDFGLAKQIGGEKLSRTGEGAGTPLYMSPEQMSGNSVDVRSDVYSLGIILYEMMVGKPPFLGEKNRIEFEVLVDDPVPPCDHNKNLAKDLEAICLKAIEKKAEQRYKTANNLAEDLRNYLEGNQISATPFTWKRRTFRWAVRHTKLLVTVVIMLGLLGIAVWQFQEASKEKSKADEAYKEKSKALEQRIHSSINSYEKDLTSQLILARLYTESLKYAAMQDVLNEIGSQQKDKDQQINALIDDLENEDQTSAAEMRKEFSSRKKSLRKAIATHKKYLPLTNFYRQLHLQYKSNANYVLRQPSWEWRLTTNDDKKIYLWKNNSGNWSRVGELPFLKTCEYAISVSGRYIAIFDTSKENRTNKLSVWKNVNGNITEQKKLNKLCEEIQGKDTDVITFSGDERWLCVAIEKKAIGDNDSFLIDLINYKKYRIGIDFSSVCFSPDSKWFAYASLYNGKVLNLEGGVPQEKHTLAGSSAIHFGLNKIFAGYFDINVYNINGNKIEKETVLYDVHQAKIKHIDAQKMFLSSYSEDGVLQIRAIGNYRKVQEVDFHKNTRSIMPVFKNDMDLGVWEKSDFYTYNKKDSITKISFPLDPKVIKVPLFRKLAEYADKNKELKAKKDQTGRHYFSKFSHNERYIIHYLFPFLYVYDTKTNIKKNMPLFHYKKMSMYNVHKIEIFKHYIIALVETTSFSALNKRNAAIVIWDLNTEKIIFDKVYSDFKKLQAKVKHMFAFHHRKIFIKRGYEVTIEKIHFSENQITIEQEDTFSLKSYIGSFKSAFYKDKVAFVSAGDSSIKPLEVVSKSNGKYFSQQIKVQLGRTTVMKFIKHNLIAIGSITGKIALVWLDTGRIEYYDFYREVKNFFYDPTEDLLLVFTASGLNVQPLHFDKENELQSKFYPITLFSNYKIIGLAITKDFNAIALSLAGGNTLLISTNEN
ncbi:serine/threonine protein kinase [Candidatus Uabimicrobium amorphum]|nr:serine/threonine-protein kinase [Candidatus Uabimicrobium amorphum]